MVAVLLILLVHPLWILPSGNRQHAVELKPGILRCQLVERGCSRPPILPPWRSGPSGDVSAPSPLAKFSESPNLAPGLATDGACPKQDAALAIEEFRLQCHSL